MASIIGGEMLEGENVSSGSRLEYLLPATLRTDWWWCGGAGLYSLFSLDVTSLHCSSDVSLDIFTHRNGLFYHVQ